MEGRLAQGAVETVAKPLEARSFEDTKLRVLYVDQVLGEQSYGDALYGVRYALKNHQRERLVRRYLETQEVTCIQEGVRLAQRETTVFDFDGDKVLAPDGQSMVMATKSGESAQQRQIQQKPELDFMLTRNKHDVGIAEDNDQRMKNLPVGSCWLRVSPFASDVTKELASEAGFFIKSQRSFVWIYRKVSDIEMASTVLSIDHAELDKFKDLLVGSGQVTTEQARELSSHDIPGFVTEVDTQIHDDETYDHMVDSLLEYFEQDNNISSAEFIENFCKPEISSLVRLQEEIEASLLDGELTEFAKRATQAVLSQDYLDELERKIVRDLIGAKILDVHNTNNHTRQARALGLVAKAHRVGVWAGINQKIKNYLASALDEQPMVASWQMQVIGSPTDYVVGGMVSQADVEQLNQNSVSTQSAADKGEVMPGCSGGSGFLSQNSESELKSSIFGGARDNLGDRYFKCSKGHDNYRRVANVPEKACRVCGEDISCGMVKKPTKKAAAKVIALASKKDKQKKQSKKTKTDSKKR